MNTIKPKPCVVCGTPVKQLNPKSNTCSNECTRARNAGITREEQIRRDMNRVPWGPRCHRYLSSGRKFFR